MAELVKKTLHQQLADLIRDGIREGRWQPGDMLPSEAALRQEYGVSPTTIRRALLALVTEGLIVVRNGKGSFVSGSYNQPAATIDRTSLAEAPRPIPTGDALQFRGTADAPMAAVLGISEDEPLFIVEVPAAEEGSGRRVLIRRMIPIEATDGHAPDPDADSDMLLAMLTRRHGKMTQTEYVRARMPNPDERSALDLSDAVPIFETIRVATAKRRTVYAETQRTSTEGVQLAYPIR
jgi:GntR family transcriptional regulator